ncbi:MAG: hypothetical protein LBR88_03140, partial [Zoogloeaceae bacterium]|nr:hypothetical protein [Zoogloeaceae bacterium]
MTSSENSAAFDAAHPQANGGRSGVAVFRWAIRLVFVSALLGTAYWLAMASDRYVSEANVIIRKTDSVGVPALDIPMLVSGISAVNRSDQLLLREYLLSVDMLRKLDAALDLRSHFSDHERDIVSRMWFQ